MLATSHRLRSSRGFSDTVRHGRRAGSATLVGHLLPAPAAEAAAHPVRVGLVVGRGVGNAVHRNRVKRRLRHLVRTRLRALPDGATLVLRALPASARASSAELGRDLDRVLARLVATPAVRR